MLCAKHSALCVVPWEELYFFVLSPFDIVLFSQFAPKKAGFEVGVVGKRDELSLCIIRSIDNVLGSSWGPTPSFVMTPLTLSLTRAVAILVEHIYYDRTSHTINFSPALTTVELCCFTNPGMLCC